MAKGSKRPAAVSGLAVKRGLRDSSAETCGRHAIVTTKSQQAFPIKPGRRPGQACDSRESMAKLPDPRLWWVPSLRSRMRADWNRRAHENAFHYVSTGKRDWTAEEFFESGRQTVREHVLNDLGNICRGKAPGQMRVLEIGCGVGRVTRALAEVFGDVHGVDVSDEMVRLARAYLHSIPNAKVYRNSGSDLKVLGDLAFDFAFSNLVFQHIPSRGVIENYVREVGARLSQGALFKFQVIGRPGRWWHRDTWFGAPFTERDAAAMAERCGFEARHMHGAGTQDFWLWFFKQ